MREKLLTFVSHRGTLLEPEAIEYLLARRDPLERLERILGSFEQPPLVVTLKDVMAAEEIARRAAGSAPRPSPSPAAFRRGGVPAADHDADVQVLRDITGHSTTQGTIEDFGRYFRHRFQVLAGMLRSRREFQGAQDIARARRSTREVRIIGMVANARATKRGHRILELEDETDRISVLVPSDSQGGEAYVPDEVLGVIGTSNERGLLIAKSLVRPDMPATAFRGAPSHLRAAFVSDLHVGSKTFLEEKWAKFIEWMNGSDPVARSIRYLVASGDLVDGIGVFPNQDEELVIDDIYAQYEALAARFADLPDHVTCIAIPGNHDAVRPAEPQPALPGSIQRLFDSNVLFVGNPCVVSLSGVRTLLYHGRSMDDFVSTIPGMSYQRPLDAMRTMLQMRHLAPIYGGKTPIAPEAQDHLIVEEVPDIFVTGHVHAVGVDRYRGTVLVNASTWQAQTAYQKMRNIDPSPAQLPIVDLANGETMIQAF